MGVQTLRPYRMALDQVFKFEASSRLLSRETVRTVGKPVDPILRIRCVLGQFHGFGPVALHSSFDAWEHTLRVRLSFL